MSFWPLDSGRELGLWRSVESLGLCASRALCTVPGPGQELCNFLGPSPTSPQQGEWHCVKAAALSLWSSHPRAQHLNKGTEREEVPKGLNQALSGYQQISDPTELARREVLIWGAAHFRDSSWLQQFFGNLSQEAVIKRWEPLTPSNERRDKQCGLEAPDAPEILQTR